MTVFGGQAVETLARLLQAEARDENWPWPDVRPAVEDIYRVKAAVMLVPVGDANRPHLTEQLAAAMRAMHAGDDDLAEAVAREIHKPATERERPSDPPIFQSGPVVLDDGTEDYGWTTG